MNMKKPKLVIAITGQVGQGNDTLADIIQEEIYKRYKSIYIEKFSFATEIEKEVSRKLGISTSLLDFLKNKKGAVFAGMSMRERLESVEDYNRSYFAKLLLTDIEAMNFIIAGVDEVDNTVSIITDLRFKNEANYLWDNLDYDDNYKFLIVRVIGKSEVECEDIRPNVVIENTGTKEDLRQKVLDLILSRI